MSGLVITKNKKVLALQEALGVIQHWYYVGDTVCRMDGEVLYKITEDMVEAAMEVVLGAGFDRERYDWNDLETRPDILPKVGELVEFAYFDFEDESRIYYDIDEYTEDYLAEMHDQGMCVIGWRYFEKFKRRNKCEN